jgi:hypothetical protein
VRRLRLLRRAPRNVAHESTVTRPRSAPTANAISNFPEADFWPVEGFNIEVKTVFSKTLHIWVARRVLRATIEQTFDLLLRN